MSADGDRPRLHSSGSTMAILFALFTLLLAMLTDFQS